LLEIFEKAFVFYIINENDIKKTTMIRVMILKYKKLNLLISKYV